MISSKFQTHQIPIFKNLIKTNNFFSGFKIVTEQQYVSIEKDFIIENKKFWLKIEIEDVLYIDEIDGFEVWLNNHEIHWLPKSHEEEMEDYPIKHSFIYNIEEIKLLIEKLSMGDLNSAKQIMENNPRF